MNEPALVSGSSAREKVEKKSREKSWRKKSRKKSGKKVEKKENRRRYWKKSGELKLGKRKSNTLLSKSNTILAWLQIGSVLWSFLKLPSQVPRRLFSFWSGIWRKAWGGAKGRAKNCGGKSPFCALLSCHASPQSPVHNGKMAAALGPGKERRRQGTWLEATHFSP